MIERLREIEGNLDINSSVHGTEIIARVPARSRSAADLGIVPLPAQEVNI
jgi:hypothetical protein